LVVARAPQQNIEGYSERREAELRAAEAAGAEQGHGAVEGAPGGERDS
jgi:hypothetical protein